MQKESNIPSPESRWIKREDEASGSLSLFEISAFEFPLVLLLGDKDL